MTESVIHQFSGFINTPQIWSRVSNFPFPAYQLKRVTLHEVVPELILPPTMVLGKRMEQFFKYYVTQFSEEIILANNEQVIHEKKTLGELDFLLRNQSTQQVIHVELVYKFYLYDPDVSVEAERWTGPNRRDNLNRKLNRLLTRQFPLLYRPETLPLLEKLNVSLNDVVQKICFKANFFFPWNSKDVTKLSPYQGSWIKASDFEGPFFNSGTYFSPKKPDWPILPCHNSIWFSFEELKDQIAPLLDKEQSPLIWMKTSRGNYKRFFVVWW